MTLDWNSGLVKHLGIRFVATEKDRIVAELEIRPELLTTTGALHGGTLNGDTLNEKLSRKADEKAKIHDNRIGR
jgi:hypothetical protein